MSLQLLNDEFQEELLNKEAPKASPLSGAIQRLRTNSLGTRLKGEYPDSQRLEELLLDSFE